MLEESIVQRTTEGGQKIKFKIDGNGELWYGQNIARKIIISSVLARTPFLVHPVFKSKVFRVNNVRVLGWTKTGTNGAIFAIEDYLFTENLVQHLKAYPRENDIDNNIINGSEEEEEVNMAGRRLWDRDQID